MNADFSRILITGASSGIGAATARALAEESGCRLFLTGRSEEKLAKVASGCGAAVAASRSADLTAPGAAAALVEAAREALGGLDAVVHAAGIGLIKPALDTTDGEFVRVTNLNVRGTFLVAQAACRHMAEQKKGRFLTFPGILGKAPMKHASAYVASKFAVTGLVKALALEFQRQNIQFTLFHFGGVDTPFWDELAMNPKRDAMIPADLAAAQVVAALAAPSHLVCNEVVLQPAGHQLG